MSSINESDPALKAFLEGRENFAPYEVVKGNSSRRYYFFNNPETKPGVLDTVEVLLKPSGEVVAVREVDKSDANIKVRVCDYGDGEWVSSKFNRFQLGDDVYHTFEYRRDLFTDQDNTDNNFAIIARYSDNPYLKKGNFPDLAIEVGLPGRTWFNVSGNAKGQDTKFSAREGVLQPGFYDCMFMPLDGVVSRLSLVSPDYTSLEFEALDVESMTRWVLGLPREVPFQYLLDRAQEPGIRGMRFNRSLPFSFEKTQFVAKKG